MALTAKQATFVREYLVDLNAKAAATRAGYSAKTAEQQGYQLLQHPSVAAAVAEAMGKRSERTDITADRVLQELGKIGFASLGDFIRLTPEGEPAIDLSMVDKERLVVLSEATVEDFTEGRGDDARDVRRVKIKLHDKLGALTQIGRHLGMFTDKVEHSGAVGIASALEAARKRAAT